MVPKMMNAYLLLVALLPCLALSEPCKYVMQPDTRVGGAYSAKLDGVHSLQACLDFLLANADSHIAVSYNREKGECCAASVDVPLSLEAESGSTTYELNKAGTDPITSTSRAQDKTTAVTSTPSQTEKTTTNPTAQCNGIDIYSGLNLINTKYTGTIRLINCTVVDNVTLAFYEAFDTKNRPQYMTWEETRSLCESVGMWLARLVSPSLLEAVADMLYVNNPRYSDYIYEAAVGGVFDPYKGNFVWYNTTIPVPVTEKDPFPGCIEAYDNAGKKPNLKLRGYQCSGSEPRFICSSE